MLETKRVYRDFRDIEKINALNERAFPENERRPLEPLMDDPTGHGEVVAFYEQGVFRGFAGLLSCHDISHIIYFAIEEENRGRGLGTRALEAMHAMKKGCRMIVDVEDESENAPNNAQRRRRIDFYRRSGYVPSEVRYNWRDEDYVILVRGGGLTGAEFGEFWRGIEADNEELTQY